MLSIRSFINLLLSNLIGQNLQYAITYSYYTHVHNFIQCHMYQYHGGMYIACYMIH